MACSGWPVIDPNTSFFLISDAHSQSGIQGIGVDVDLNDAYTGSPMLRRAPLILNNDALVDQNLFIGKMP
jgi:hypothetical protein